MGVLKYDTLMGKHGFRALFTDQYVCVYKIEGDTVYIYHLADARKNYKKYQREPYIPQPHYKREDL